MPPKPSWIKRIPQIRGALERLEEPFVDRRALEELFKVSSRRAMKIAHEMGSLRVGHSLAVPRSRALAFVKSRELGIAHEVEVIRRRRVREALEEAQRDIAARQVKIDVRPAATIRSVANLPDSIQIEPGRLRIAFSDAQDLLAQLFQLSQAISRDYVRFEEAIRS